MGTTLYPPVFKRGNGKSTIDDFPNLHRGFSIAMFYDTRGYLHFAWWPTFWQTSKSLAIARPGLGQRWHPLVFAWLNRWCSWKIPCLFWTHCCCCWLHQHFCWLNSCVLIESPHVCWLKPYSCWVNHSIVDPHVCYKYIIQTKVHVQEIGHEMMMMMRLVSWEFSKLVEQCSNPVIPLYWLDLIRSDCQFNYNYIA